MIINTAPFLEHKTNHLTSNKQVNKTDNINYCFSKNHDSTNEPRHEKTNNVVSEQLGHKPSCTSTEDGYRLEILD